jgi:hypothetical protein
MHTAMSKTFSSMSYPAFLLEPFTTTKIENGGDKKHHRRHGES